MINFKKNFFSITLFLLIIYFMFNLLSGERGLFSYYEKKNFLSNLEKYEYNLSQNIKMLELHNSLLTEKIDLDFVEILIRKNFQYGKKNETIYLTNTDENR